MDELIQVIATALDIVECELTAGIIDYKSSFTKKHSVQIANRAWLMSEYYGFDSAKRAKVFLAASLHDIGKLTTPNIMRRCL